MTASDRPRIAAFFDMDGTVLHTNIVLYYVELMTYGMSKTARAFWIAGFLLWIPVFVIVDKFSRAAFNRLFYRLYKGADAETIRAHAWKTFEEFTLQRLFADAHQAVKEHQKAGHTTVFVTGTTTFIAEPLAEYLGVDHVFAVELEEKDGIFTGALLTDPMSDELKAETVREFAAEHNIDLAESFAYGDSIADAPMLQMVGNPVAVNPSNRLRLLAMRHQWQIARWT
ncbi:MAG: HAD-IB family hydrolase [Candidatus Poribacteria bacterium]|nr:HAD-IB family hydrolase [Candidatus Poribacteria bacterium]